MLSKLTRQYFTQYFTQRFITSVEPIKTSSLPHNIEVKTPDEISEALADMPTFVPPTFNFASYVNKSETLKKFVELGVDLSKIEKKKGFPQFVLTLDFEKDVKKLLFFLHDLGLPAEDYGSFITKNPLIFKESLKDLETRVYYLQSKKFSAEQIQRVVSKNPFWLSFSTKRIDRRLGWFQKNFNLQGDDIRVLASTAPRLITYNLEHVREAMFSIKEELGFTKQEMKLLLLRNPRVWMRSKLKWIWLNCKIINIPSNRPRRTPRAVQLRTFQDAFFARENSSRTRSSVNASSSPQDSSRVPQISRKSSIRRNQARLRFLPLVVRRQRRRLHP